MDTGGNNPYRKLVRAGAADKLKARTDAHAIARLRATPMVSEIVNAVARHMGCRAHQLGALHDTIENIVMAHQASRLDPNTAQRQTPVVNQQAHQPHHMRTEPNWDDEDTVPGSPEAERRAATRKPPRGVLR